MQNFCPSSLCPCKDKGTVKETRCVRRRSLQRKCSSDITCARYSCWLKNLTTLLLERLERRTSRKLTGFLLATGRHRESSRRATMFSVAFEADNRGVLPEPLTHRGLPYYVV